MALMIRCDRHDIGYVVGDLYPAWWIMHNVPGCPLCRLEWIEEHEDEWDFPVPYKMMWATAHRALSDCTGLSNLTI